MRAQPTVGDATPGQVLLGAIPVILKLWVATPLDQMILSQGSYIRYPAHQGKLQDLPCKYLHYDS